MFVKIMFPEKPKKKEPEKSNKCKIIIKRKSDGTIIKAIEGNCTKEQLRALSRADDSED